MSAFHEHHKPQGFYVLQQPQHPTILEQPTSLASPAASTIMPSRTFSQGPPPSSSENPITDPQQRANYAKLQRIADAVLCTLNAITATYQNQAGQPSSRASTHNENVFHCLSIILQQFWRAFLELLSQQERALMVDGTERCLRRVVRRLNRALLVKLMDRYEETLGKRMRFELQIMLDKVYKTIWHGDQ